MNFKILSIKRLTEFINSTKDLVLLEKAEQEYINRTCKSEENEAYLYWATGDDEL